VFALAAIVYEMLTAKVAFEAPSLARILVRIMQEEPMPPSKVAVGTPGALDAVIARGLRKDKLERFSGARELADAVIAAYGLSGTAEDFAKAPDAETKKKIDEAPARPAAKKADDQAAGEGATAANKAAPAKSSAAGEARPSKVKVTMVAGAGALTTAATAAKTDVGRATVPTGTRASSLPPLPRTGLDGKMIAIIVLGVILAGGLLTLLLR